MMNQSKHDAWSAGDSYDNYMGRWSRKVAPEFLSWLDASPDKEWLEVGCGTGALAAAIVNECEPASLVAIDPSEGFLAKARSNVSDPRVEFRKGEAGSLPLPDASRDIVASALVLNFVPDRAKAMSEIKRVLRSNGRFGFYVWDYPGGGIEFMRAFWTAAVALDPAARELTEDKRFPFCTRDGLIALTGEAGFSSVECDPIEVPTVFSDFDDYWRPFTLGAGPAPGYCVTLEPAARERLRDRLEKTLPANSDGSIPMKARAWAIKALPR
jgi:SAM-dependent methyltransferase